jgi:hypothetical protein
LTDDALNENAVNIDELRYEAIIEKLSLYKEQIIGDLYSLAGN